MVILSDRGTIMMLTFAIVGVVILIALAVAFVGALREEAREERRRKRREPLMTPPPVPEADPPPPAALRNGP